MIFKVFIERLDPSTGSGQAIPPGTGGTLPRHNSELEELEG